MDEGVIVGVQNEIVGSKKGVGEAARAVGVFAAKTAIAVSIPPT